MKIRRIAIIVGTLFSIVPAQNISIGGVITDSVSGSPVSQAEVSLLGRRIVDTTDIDGAFSIRIDAMATFNSRYRPAGATVPFITPDGFFTVALLQQQEVVMHGYTLRGQMIYSLHETWAEGLHRVAVHAAASGITLFKVIIDGESYTIKRNISGGMSTTIGSGAPIMQSGKVAAVQSGDFNDTLLVAKNGYLPAKIPVTDTALPNLSIKLRRATAVSAPSGSILFTAAKPRGGILSDNYFEIYSMKADRSGIAQLTFNDYKDCRGRWSPDGKKVAFVRITGATTKVSEIWMMNADGSNQERITEGDYVCFSPNGSKLAITNNSLFVYDVPTKSLATLVESTIYTGTTGLPDWSPDGKTITYVNHFVYADGTTYGNYRNIYLINSDGSNRRQLTKINEFSSSKNATDPRWSPSGLFIVYDVDNSLSLMKADGTQQTSLGVNPVYYPLFSPDGSYVIVSLNGKIVQVKMDSSFSKTTLTTDDDGICYPLDWKDL